MTNQVQTQPTKIVAARVPPEFHRLVRVEAAKRDFTISNAVQQGLELWLLLILFACPKCGHATACHSADQPMADAGVRYCPNCQESVTIKLEDALGKTVGQG